MSEAILEESIKNAIEEYQCSGCTNGSDISCYKRSNQLPSNVECLNHSAGTNMLGLGWILLGMPTGFNRLGMNKDTEFCIFNCLGDGWGYNKYNTAVWKHLNKEGHTLVRGLSPRTSKPFIHVFLGLCG